MIDINILLTQMLSLFIILFIGFFIYKIKLIDDRFSQSLTKLVLNVTGPCLLLSSVFNMGEQQATANIFITLGVGLVQHLILFPTIGFIVTKLLRVKKKQEGIYIFITTFANCGFMGFPVIEALFGATGLFYAAIHNLTFNFAIYSIGIWLMNKDRLDGEKFHPKMLITPGIISSMLTILFYFINIEVPEVIVNTLDMVGSITSPAAMLVIGFSLAKIDIKHVFNDWRMYIWIAIRQILIPLLIWYPLSLVVSDQMLLMVLFILMTMPVANMVVLFANIYNGDTVLGAKAVFITTLLALISVPLCVWLVSNLG